MLKQLFFDYDQSGRRGHSRKLFKRRSRPDIRKFAFSNRIVKRVLLKAAPATPAAPATINDTYCSGPRVSFFSGHMKISRRNAITMLPCGRLS